ncbi:transmembrane protein [Arabidopsis thaliana]|uniref:AT5g24060/MZF18_6 n=1 Tax=Arabidopsis thaliana TaxID=3702 RepID=Q8VYI6_ARATH|nr:uncharacterized protein AT2G23987 [Arabidopsis thaliana]AAL50087.1 AT5g24060/MZF18_6 [Arabidopsis thaliana]AAM10363.1 AT5g24060/MZF18_6 [Arabidopsis thaliana]ANM61673.1 transmembrane protein [Arabidopsis thaliana]|eukprot:NP_001323877.1 transmembrane protein [Arabidopsis thaliana]
MNDLVFNNLCLLLHPHRPCFHPRLYFHHLRFLQFPKPIRDGMLSSMSLDHIIIIRGNNSLHYVFIFLYLKVYIFFVHLNKTLIWRLRQRLLSKSDLLFSDWVSLPPMVFTVFRFDESGV